MFSVTRCVSVTGAKLPSYMATVVRGDFNWQWICVHLTMFEYHWLQMHLKCSICIIFIIKRYYIMESRSNIILEISILIRRWKLEHKRVNRLRQTETLAAFLFIKLTGKCHVPTQKVFVNYDLLATKTLFVNMCKTLLSRSDPSQTFWQRTVNCFGKETTYTNAQIGTNLEVF